MAAAPSDALAADHGLLGCLERGDAIAARGWLVGRYLAGASIAELSDGPVRSAMHALGELWHHDERGVFIEHRATEACLQALAYLRGTLPERLAGPLALGAAPRTIRTGCRPSWPRWSSARPGCGRSTSGPIPRSRRCSTPSPSIARAWSGSAPPASSRRRAPQRSRAGSPGCRGTIVAVIGGRNAGAIAAVLPSVRHADAMAELAVIARKLAQ
jgi:hypothetical protein